MLATSRMVYISFNNTHTNTHHQVLSKKIDPKIPSFFLNSNFKIFEFCTTGRHPSGTPRYPDGKDPSAQSF